MKKTTADVPKSVASEYSKARRPQAVSEAVGDGYTKTKQMQKARSSPASRSQFGLPKSPPKGGLRLRISIEPDHDDR